MKPDHILAIDQGTTGSTALLFAADGSLCGKAYAEFTQHFPQPGWVEHDPNEIWRTSLGVMQQALREAKLSAEDIAAVGITNQRETIVLWDRASGEPVAPAIVWQDRRTADHCAQLKAAGHEPTFRAATGLLLDPYFSGTKIAWLLEHHPELRRRAQAGELACGTIDSWLIWKLSGHARHVTDPSNASRTLLYNIREARWDSELLKLLDIPAALLPELVPSSGVCAETDPTLFGGRLPIAGLAGDQQAALFGQACHQPGTSKNTYGTGCFMLTNTGTRAATPDAGLLTTVAWQLQGQPLHYALEGGVFIAGAAVQWLRDGLGLIASAAETEALAQSLDGNDGVYFVPALTGLGTPHWDPYARGTIVGLTRGTTRAHFVRAALEGIAFQCLDVVRAMEQVSGESVRMLRVDGGAVANDFLMQFQADLLGIPVEIPEIAETTALGAAGLAGLGVGLWDVAAFAERWQRARLFEPAMPSGTRDRLHQRWLQAVERAKGWEQR